MKWTSWPVLLLVAFFAGCAHLPVPASAGARTRARLWDEAHQALDRLQFRDAAKLFEEVAREYPDSREGVEAHFFLGAMAMDPRNPGWSPSIADTTLHRYLALDSTSALHIARRPEATVLLQLATQLNMPPASRVAQLQPETRVVTVPPRVVRAEQSRSLQVQVDSLRRLVADRDSVIRRQTEELERIRRTLAPRGQE
jgi:hypothetical protein